MPENPENNTKKNQKNHPKSSLKSDLKTNLKRPLITVITPLYNRRKTIERTMRSVENQTFSQYRIYYYRRWLDGSSG